MALSLDGSVAVYGQTSGFPVVTGALSCASAGNVIVVVALVNGGVTVSSVTGSGATFTKHTDYTTNLIEIWTGYASGTFNSAITVNYSAAPAYSTVHAFGVNGSTSSSYFDVNGGVPNTGGTDPRTISTTASDTFIIGAFRFGATSDPTAGTGFTTILGNSGSGYMLTEYKIVTSPQSSLSVPVGTGVGDANGAIATALVAASGGSVTISGSACSSGQGDFSKALSIQL